MTDSKIERQRAAAIRAQERLGDALARENNKKRKSRDRRVLKLGVAAELLLRTGDVTLSKRLEAVVLERFGSRPIDRLDFELDQPLNWFAKVRAEALAGKGGGDGVVGAKQGSVEVSRSQVSTARPGTGSSAQGGGAAPNEAASA